MNFTVKKGVSEISSHHCFNFLFVNLDRFPKLQQGMATGLMNTGTPVIPSRLLDECFSVTHNKLIFFAYPKDGNRDLKFKYCCPILSSGSPTPPLSAKSIYFSEKATMSKVKIFYVSTTTTKKTTQFEML